MKVNGRVLALVASLVALTTITGEAFSQEKSIVVADGGGSYQEALRKAIYDPFEQATGIKVLAVSYDYMAGSIKAQVEGPKQWDVVVVGNPISKSLQQQLLLPIDYDVVKQPGLPDWAKQERQVVYTGFAYGIAYRDEDYPTPPKSWADVWDSKKFPGPRAMMNYPVGMLEAALLADGVKGAELYPLDVDRAFKKIKQLNETAEIVWWDTSAQMVQNFTNAVTPIGFSTNGRILDARKDNFPVSWVLDDSIVVGTAFGVLSTAPNPDLAMQFVNFASSPESGAREATEFPGNMPMNAKAFDGLPSEIADSLPTNPKFANRIGVSVDLGWWEDNFDDVYPRWVEFYTSLQ